MKIARAQGDQSGGCLKRPSALSRFRRDREGTTAVEFGLVAFPFIFAMLATMEIAMVIWQGQLLSNGVAVVSRKIYTGEIQLAGGTSASVRTALCAEVSSFIPCASIDIDVRPGTDPPNPITSQNTYDASSYGYVKVDAKKIGSVTASLKYKGFFPALAGIKLADGNRVIISTAAFMAEPYS